MKMIFITKRLIRRMEFVLAFNLRQRHHHNNMSWISVSEGYLNALRDFHIITDDEYFKLGTNFGMFRQLDLEGCENCHAGSSHGSLINGLDIGCHSALLGLDDNLNYSHRYTHLKKGEKYPDWCPVKKEIKIKEVI